MSRSDKAEFVLYALVAVGDAIKAITTHRAGFHGLLGWPTWLYGDFAIWFAYSAYKVKRDA